MPRLIFKKLYFLNFYTTSCFKNLENFSIRKIFPILENITITIIFFYDHATSYDVFKFDKFLSFTALKMDFPIFDVGNLEYFAYNELCTKVHVSECRNSF